MPACVHSVPRVSHAAMPPQAVGMQAVAECVRKQGLLLGIYGDSGRYTCQGFPGSYGHEREDAQTFADWGEWRGRRRHGCFALASAQVNPVAPQLPLLHGSPDPFHAQVCRS